MSTLPIDLRRKAVTVALLLAGATLAGPFGTYEDLTFGERFLYWGTAIIGCGLIMEGLLIAALSYPILALPAWARLCAAVLVGSFPGAVLVLSLEYGVRGYEPAPLFALRVWTLVGVIALLISLIEYRTALRGQPANPGPEPVPISPEADRTTTFDRVQHGTLFFRSVDPAIGHRLVSMSKQGHYLEVVTRDGRALILKRIADAVAELGDYPGLQIHRSHWVALDAVRDLERENGRVVARLDDGRSLPISRPNVTPLRTALAAGNRAPLD